jgi:hypothetical protein
MILAERCSDYAVVIIMGVFIFASVSWIVSAHKWFIGPVKTVNEDADAMSGYDDNGKQA